MLNHLKDHVLSWVPQEPTADLCPDTLQALSALMLAQAQDAIYMKASKGESCVRDFSMQCPLADKMKPGILVKITNQCADLYQEANRLMSRDVVKGMWEKEWLSTVTGKQLAFAALAQYHRAQECKEAKVSICYDVVRGIVRFCRRLERSWHDCKRHLRL